MNEPWICWKDFQSCVAGAQFEGEFLELIRTLAERHGYFYLSFEGEESAEFDGLFDQALEWSKRFFALPIEEKMKIRISPAKHYRGYGVFGQEMTLGAPDQKETLDLGFEEKAVAREELLEAPYLILRGPNQWPEVPSLFHSQGFHECHEFKEFFQLYLEKMRRIGERVLEAVIAAYGGAFPPSFRSGYGMLRLLHYPGSRFGEGLGVGPHTDAGLLVLLLQDQIGGLQAYCDEKKAWVDVSPRRGTLVVQFGEMLQLLVGGKATLHRVVQQGETSRYSLPFFFEPPLDAKISVARKSAEGLATEEGGEAGVLYGDRMLRVFERSFPQTAP